MSFSIRSSRLGANVYPDLSVLNSEVSSYSKHYPVEAQAQAQQYHEQQQLLTGHYPSAPMLLENRAQQILACYLPKNAEDGVYSCTHEKGGKKMIFTDDTRARAAIVPAGAIIDSVEFFGYNGFATKDVFTIGLGQLNADITFPLIQDTDTTIANERVGGYRDFVSCECDGKNNRNIVISPSFVNVCLSSPVTQGGLEVVIRYHVK